MTTILKEQIPKKNLKITNPITKKKLKTILHKNKETHPVHFYSLVIINDTVCQFVDQK